MYYEAVNDLMYSRWIWAEQDAEVETNDEENHDVESIVITRDRVTEWNIMGYFGDESFQADNQTQSN